MDRARLRLIFELKDRELEFDGVVAYSNVPGNLQRPNLPMGMGVRFEEVDNATAKHLKSYVKGKLAQLEV